MFNSSSVSETKSFLKMKFLTAICVASLAVVFLASVTEARSRHHRHHRDPETRPVQVEEPKPVEIEPKPVEIEPAQSVEAIEGSAEKTRPARARRLPVICNVSPDAANLEKPNKVEAVEAEPESVEAIAPESEESFEFKSVEDEDVKPAKKVVKPKVIPLPASSEESESVEPEESEEASLEAIIPQQIQSIESIEEPEEPKAIEAEEASAEAVQAVESEEEKPKARRSKHHRKDIRRIEKPRSHRRRVVFHSDEDE
ncbi:unnamed protein product [Orchesella dallaii]|uniref:Uncharacterized protein n=1 Tax=Orchesella dallaii TaxID=48710 RepID=A0ABP1R9P7_9HEXA